MNTQDTLIEQRAEAMRRREVRLRALRLEASGACCPTCYHGRRYTDLADRQTRAGEVLRRDLARRGTQKDIALAEAIRVSAWP